VCYSNSTALNIVSPMLRCALTTDYNIDGIVQLPIATLSVLASIGHESRIQKRNHTCKIQIVKCFSGLRGIAYTTSLECTMDVLQLETPL
jgi:hypothetical protein